MGNITYTDTQIERLLSLGAGDEDISAAFFDTAAREQVYAALEKSLVKERRADLDALLHDKRRPETELIKDALIQKLTQELGFTQVTTPTFITLDMLDRMNVTEDDPLREQVYYIGKNRCLRPMLAPNLYVMMREMKRIAGEAVRIFEVGSCFRKETSGARHLSEFTMLNLVELGTEDGMQLPRLEELARSVMEAVGADPAEYELTRESSTVYGETVDIEWRGIEVASCSYGPHALDPAWKVWDPWVGIGLGIERLAMIKRGARTVRQVGRSISFTDGINLSI